MRIALPLSIAALALHLATAGRYGYFRDELYFIACAHHLAWGYVDQPPLVAIAAWLSAPAGFALTALRLLPALCGALTVAVVVAFVGELGGGTAARWIAGLLALLLPAYLLLGNTLTTTSFEPLTWTLAIYCAVRLVRSDGAPQWWIALALDVAFGLYGKYSIALLVAALLVGLAVTPQRRIVRGPWPFVAAALALVLVLPNLLWQLAHGWPIVTVLLGDAAHRPAFRNGLALQYAGVQRNAGAFLAEQILYTNPLAAPIWLAGIAAPFRSSRLADVRFVAVAALVAIGAALLLAAKGYYVIGIYGALLAIGATWLEHAPRALRTALFTAALALGIAIAPFAVPVLSVKTLVAYGRALHLTGSAQPHLVQAVFAEEFGWRRLAADVARVYATLSPRERAQATIYADTYGDAGALDFFGPHDGLPPAVSSQNAYFLWGPGSASGEVLVAVGASRVDLLRRYYRHVRLVATSFDPYRWIAEGPAPIYICTDPVAPLRAIWPHLRWYGA